MALDQDEYEFPDEKSSKEEVSIEIEDDTPEADRGRKPLPKDLVEVLEKDDLSEYSDRVKERMHQLKKVWHDERREKEAASREREEAIRFAQTVAQENKRLKSTLTNGEESYVGAIKQSATHEMDLAKREYREAFDSGDTDRIIDAQQKMNSVQYKLTQVQNYQPQYKNTLQEQDIPVNVQPDRPQAPTPDRKALAWQDNNEWFGSDEEMTNLALGLHEKLVREKIDPTSEEYYQRIDNTMRKRFPEYFQGDSLDDEQPAQRTKQSTVVAPASRSTAPKKVRLNHTQLALAKKFGLTPEQYAREAMKLENR